jgi:hypothetical protein
METIEALKQLGFVQTANSEMLTYHFGNFTLSAIQTINRHFVEIILVSGVFSNHRMISEVRIEMPLQIESNAQAAAFIAWGINEQIGRNFTPQNLTQWLEEGKNNFDLLPWTKEQKIYNERPKCLVKREWLKLALRDLNLILPELDETDSFFITFQKGVFSIQSVLKTIVFPAVGNDWTNEYQITVSNFNRFPKRLNQAEIEISVWNNKISLANWSYSINLNKQATSG